MSIKRQVLEYTTGYMKGMFQIVGLTSAELPHLAGPFQVGNGPVVDFASLIRVRERWIHYREVLDKGSLSGRLGDYFPGNRVGSMDPKQQ